MEPFNIDKIIKEKASETHGLHQQEIDAAKPFVWSEIRRENSRRYLTWIHLAAAVLLLMFCFSMVLINVQKNHEKEMKNLSVKMDRIQHEYAVQTKALTTKTNQIISLTNQQMELNEKLSDTKTTPIAQSERIVYHTDTVIIKQVEYITAISKSAEPTETLMEKEGFLEVDKPSKEAKTREVDEIIFPSYESQGKPPETLRVKFGSFASNKD